MSVTNQLSQILSQLQKPFSAESSQGSSEPLFNLVLDPEPLCASAGKADSFVKHELNQSVLFSPTAYWQSGLRLFQSEAIPLANVNVNTSSISFGDVKVGSSSSRSFSISNNSDCPVNYSISGSPYGFSISSSGGSLSARGSTSVSVTFSPNYEQSYSGYINVTPGSGSVYVSGNGKKN